MVRRLIFGLVSSLACVATIFAQTTGPTPFTGQVARPGGTNRPVDMVTMQYPNSDVLDVLHLYESLTGKKLVIDNNVQGKVNIFIAKPIPRDEAISIIEMNLALNGFSLVPVGGDIVAVTGINKNPRAAAVPIVSDPADLPQGALVVSYLFHLNYADPQELQQVLSQYLAGIGGQAPILAMPKSSALLITQSADVLRKMVKIVEQLDVAPAEVTSLFIKLERADAQKVVDMLKDIFEKNDQGPVTPGVRRHGMINPAPQGQGGEDEGGAVLSEESLIVGKIRLEADVRTNRIHVITRPVNLPFIEKLIAEFDANVEFGQPVVRPLKYIAAADVLPVLVNALTEPGEEAQQGQGANQPGQQRNPQRNPTPSNNQQYTGTNTSGTGGESTLQVNEELSTEPVDTAPQSVTVGNTKLIADARANSIIVLGTREVIVKVTKILDEMDVKAPQVALSTVIGELRLTGNEEFGVDYFLQFKKNNINSDPNVGIGGGLNNTTAPVIDPASLITFPAFDTLPLGATAYVAAGNTLTTIIKALDQTGRFRTISRPTVFTSNNKKAIIASGTEIPVPVSTISAATGTSIINTGLSQQSNIEFKKVALQLEVVPLINSEKEVSLDILQKVDSVAGTTTIDNNQIPNIATRYIRTTVSAPNLSTIVLGGLIQDQKDRSRNGFPILDRLPVIGAIFGNTLKTKERTELIILMRPEVTLSKMDFHRLRQKTEDRTHFGPELQEDDCPDCPQQSDGKQLPPPDLPVTK